MDLKQEKNSKRHSLLYLQDLIAIDDDVARGALLHGILVQLPGGELISVACELVDEFFVHAQIH